jgi:copper resistance protein B
MKATPALLIAAPLIVGVVSAYGANATTANAPAADAAAAAARADAHAAAADATAADVTAADATAADAHANVPPVAHEMSYRQMVDIMQMDDTSRFAKVMFDQFEWRNGDVNEGRAAWDAQAYYGGDYDKLWIKTEGKYATQGRTGVHDADVEVLWDRVISSWWNVQAGGRQDFGSRESRTWAVLGIQGLAPQWLQTEASVYISDEGRTAARLKAQYELLLTQRLVLQPFAEANFYGHPDAAHEIGSGLSDVEISVRLRYEAYRQFAPYMGVVWLRRFGGTADLVRAAGGEESDLELTAGLRVWF